MKIVEHGKPVRCTECQSEDVVKGGKGRHRVMDDGVLKRAYVQRYWCKKCGKNFTPQGDDTVIVKILEGSQEVSIKHGKRQTTRTGDRENRIYNPPIG